MNSHHTQILRTQKTVLSVKCIILRSHILKKGEISFYQSHSTLKALRQNLKIKNKKYHPKRYR